MWNWNFVPAAVSGINCWGYTLFNTLSIIIYITKESLAFATYCVGDISEL